MGNMSLIWKNRIVTWIQHGNGIEIGNGNGKLFWTLETAILTWIFLCCI